MSTQYISDAVLLNNPATFEKIKRDVKFPVRPSLTKTFLKKEDFEKESDFYLAMADISAEYEKKHEDYLEKLKEAKAEVQHIEERFKAYALEECFFTNVPDDIQQATYEQAKELTEGENYQFLFSVLSNLTLLVSKAYFEGCESAKKQD